MQRTTNEDELKAISLLAQREVDCMLLVQERTSVPVPKVFGYASSVNNEIGAPFMLMECLPGNVAIEMEGSSTDIPAQHKAAFYAAMAKFQVRGPIVCYCRL